MKIFSARAGNALIVFIGIAFFSRYLDQNQLGSFFLFQALLSILVIPANFGIRGAVEKRISEGKQQNELFTTAILLKLIPLSLISVGILLFGEVINNFVGIDIALYLLLAIVLQEFAQLVAFAIRGELRVGETAVLQLSRQVVWFIISTILVFSGFGAYGLVYGLVIGFAIMFLLGLFRTSLSFSQPSIDHASSLLKYSKYDFISSVGGSFYHWMDVVVIGIFLTEEMVGAYEIAWRITIVVMLVSKSLATAAFPQVSSLDADGAYRQIEALISDLLLPALIFVIPAFLGTILFARKILGLVFTPEYTVAWLVLIILMGEKLFQAPHIILGRSLHGINRPDLAARAIVVALLLNASLNLVLVWQFGIIGAASATVLSAFVNSSFHAYYLSQFLTIRIPYYEIIWCIVSSIVMAGVLLIVRHVVEINSLSKLGAVIFLGMFTYIVSLLLYPKLRIKILNQFEELLPSRPDIFTK